MVARAFCRGALESVPSPRGVPFVKLLPFLLIVAAYVAFEFHAMSKAAYRMEPLYVFDQHASADQAQRLCGTAKAGAVGQFERNFVAVQRRATKGMQDDEPGVGVEAITRNLLERRANRFEEIGVLYAEEGCEGKQMRVWLRRFDIFANSGVGGPPKKSPPEDSLFMPDAGS